MLSVDFVKFAKFQNIAIPSEPTVTKLLASGENRQLSANLE